ncbi:MAG: recombination-associated protein RdgC [Deltaproteobacteria bacterium]|jgi:DNA recombination-dependent growth factor C|nr:recombination-associated protein RdgC [Deltaproteobacteria bacterium]
MSFAKGGATFTRYRITEEPVGGITEDFIAERLTANAFVDIEETSEESSVGWVQFFNHLNSTFPLQVWSFSELAVFTLRSDERKLPNKILNRYLAIAVARFTEETGRAPNSVKKKELKDALRHDLLRRSLLDTSLLEVIWLTKINEIWLGAAGEKNRALFEEAWLRTFGLGLKILVPITIGLEILKKPLQDRLMELSDTTIFGLSGH